MASSRRLWQRGGRVGVTDDPYALPRVAKTITHAEYPRPEGEQGDRVIRTSDGGVRVDTGATMLVADRTGSFIELRLGLPKISFEIRKGDELIVARDEARAMALDGIDRAFAQMDEALSPVDRPPHHRLKPPHGDAIQPRPATPSEVALLDAALGEVAAA